MAITLDAAMKALDAARTKAADEGIRVAATIVDDGGHIVATHRMDGAYLSAVTIANTKAFSAVNFRVPTAAMAERLSDMDYQALICLADTRLTFLGGGVPLADESGTVIGAIGVSGGSAQQDVLCCEAALATLG